MLLDLLTILAMNTAFSIWEFSLVAGSFALGVVAAGVYTLLARRATRQPTAGPLTVKVKGVNELIVIPEHYNSAAIDKLLRQLEIS